MDHTAFADVGGIQELSFDEVEQVDGGILPVILFVAGVALGVLACYALDKYANS